MNFLDYNGLEYFWTIVSRKIEEKPSQDALDAISIILNPLSSWFIINEDNSSCFFNGFSKNLSMADKSKESGDFIISLVGSSDLITLSHFNDNAQISQNLSNKRAQLKLGNPLTDSNNIKTRGEVLLYGSNSHSATLKYEGTTGSSVLNLPETSGTLALKSEVETVATNLSALNGTVNTLSTTVYANSVNINSLFEAVANIDGGTWD